MTIDDRGLSAIAVATAELRSYDLLILPQNQTSKAISTVYE